MPCQRLQIFPEVPALIYTDRFLQNMDMRRFVIIVIIAILKYLIPNTLLTINKLYSYIRAPAYVTGTPRVFQKFCRINRVVSSVDPFAVPPSSLDRIPNPPMFDLCGYESHPSRTSHLRLFLPYPPMIPYSKRTSALLAHLNNYPHISARTAGCDCLNSPVVYMYGVWCVRRPFLGMESCNIRHGGGGVGGRVAESSSGPYFISDRQDCKGTGSALIETVSAAMPKHSPSLKLESQHPKPHTCASSAYPS